MGIFMCFVRFLSTKVHLFLKKTKKIFRFFKKNTIFAPKS